jgi:hypothetical protein
MYLSVTETEERPNAQGGLFCLSALSNGQGGVLWPDQILWDRTLERKGDGFAVPHPGGIDQLLGTIQLLTSQFERSAPRSGELPLFVFAHTINLFGLLVGLQLMEKLT